MKWFWQIDPEFRFHVLQRQTSIFLPQEQFEPKMKPSYLTIQPINMVVFWLLSRLTNIINAKVWFLCNFCDDFTNPTPPSLVWLTVVNHLCSTLRTLLNITWQWKLLPTNGHRLLLRSPSAIILRPKDFLNFFLSSRRLWLHSHSTGVPVTWYFRTCFLWDHILRGCTKLHIWTTLQLSQCSRKAVSVCSVLSKSTLD